MRSQHNNKMTTSHFDIVFTRSNHLQIARLMYLQVDILVSLMFIVIFIRVNELSGVNVGKKNHPSTIIRLLGKLGVKDHNHKYLESVSDHVMGFHPRWLYFDYFLQVNYTTININRIIFLNTKLYTKWKQHEFPLSCHFFLAILTINSRNTQKDELGICGVYVNSSIMDEHAQVEIDPLEDYRLIPTNWIP